MVSKYWRSEPDFVEAMEVYEFMHGEKVVRQGDTDGAPRPHGPTGNERTVNDGKTMEKMDSMELPVE